MNAFTSAELIAWLDRKMVEHDAGKLIPPDDILADQFNEQARPRVEDAVNAAIDSRYDDVVDAIKADEAEARKPILAELDRISAPLLAELARVRAPLLERMRAVSEPFRGRIGTVQAVADAIDREAEVHRVIERMRLAAAELRIAIGKAFAEEQTRHWGPVLIEITDTTEVSAIDIELTEGNEPNQSPDEGGEGGES